MSSGTRRFEIHLDHVLIRGFDWVEPDLLLVDIERELHRLWHLKGPSPMPARGNAHRIPDIHIDLPAGSSQDRLAAAAAHALWSGESHVSIETQPWADENDLSWRSDR